MAAVESRSRGACTYCNFEVISSEPTQAGTKAMIEHILSCGSDMSVQVEARDLPDGEWEVYKTDTMSADLVKVLHGVLTGGGR